MPVKVRQVMQRHVRAVGPDTPGKQVLALLHETHQSAVPVIDDVGRVIGVVSETDLLDRTTAPAERRRHFLRHRDEVDGSAGALMTTPAVTVPAGSSVQYAAQLAHDHDVRQLPVIDLLGRLTGMVSRADLLGVYLRPDDEIAAEIRDRVFVHGFCLDPDAVGVEVHDGVAVLRGQLDAFAVKKELVEAVRLVTGVLAVDDRLSVLRRPPRPELPAPLY